MKVLEINTYNYKVGGTETVFFNTSRLLEDHGDEVVSFTLKWDKNLPSKWEKYFPESKETRKGVAGKIKSLFAFFYHREAAKKLEELIKAEKPDISQTHLFWCQITPSIFPVLKKYNIPLVFTVHDYRTVCPAATFRNGKGQICEQCQGKHTWHCAQHRCIKNSLPMSVIAGLEMKFRNTFFNPAKYIESFVYVSKFAKDKLEQYMPALKNVDNIVLYNMTEDVVAEPKKTIPSDKYYLFYGRLSYEKGINTLVDAFLSKPDCRLKLVGTGDEMDSIKQRIASAGAKNIELLGFKSGKELFDLVRNAYFIFVPSEWYENNPMTIVEGYSMATPVIGARIGGIPEIIVDGETGFSFESGSNESLLNALVKAETLDEEMYSEMSAKSRQFAIDNFEKEHYYTVLTDFFKKVINKK